MFKRLFWATVGLGAGAVIGVWAVRKAQQTSHRLRPDVLAAAGAKHASGLGQRLRDALEEGKRAAAAKETELRSVYGGRRRADTAPPGGASSA